MDVTVARQKFGEVVLLDVREQPEWDAGHIDGAIHLPMSQLNERQEEIPSSDPIICVCRSGQRSAVVTQALQRAGYDAQNLEGGMLAWVESGSEIVTDHGGPATII